MQLTNVFTFIAIAIAGVSALPGGHGGGDHPPPPPSPPVINHQVNYCSSGNPYCCSPNSDHGSNLQGTTCVLSTTQCNSVSICCNNAANNGNAVCSAATSIPNFLSSSTTAVVNTSPNSRPSPAPQPARSSSQLSSCSARDSLLLLTLLVLFV